MASRNLVVPRKAKKVIPGGSPAPIVKASGPRKRPPQLQTPEIQKAEQVSRWIMEVDVPHNPTQKRKRQESGPSGMEVHDSEKVVAGNIEQAGDEPPHQAKKRKVDSLTNSKKG